MICLPPWAGLPKCCRSPSPLQVAVAVRCSFYLVPLLNQCVGRQKATEGTEKETIKMGHMDGEAEGGGQIFGLVKRDSYPKPFPFFFFYNSLSFSLEQKKRSRLGDVLWNPLNPNPFHTPLHHSKHHSEIQGRSTQKLTSLFSVPYSQEKQPQNGIA